MNNSLTTNVRFKSIKSTCTNGAPGHILHSTTAGFTRSGWPWIDFDWPWIKTNQRFLSVLRWISVRGCWTKKFGPLVVTLSLEFSRLPAMLSPLKTTLFPVPALTPRRQIGECIHCSTWRYWSWNETCFYPSGISLNATYKDAKLLCWPVDIKNRGKDGFRLS